MLGINGGTGDRRMNSGRHRLRDYMLENPKFQDFYFSSASPTIEKNDQPYFKRELRALSGFLYNITL